MTIGLTPTAGQLNNQAGQLMVNLRNAVQQASAFHDYLAVLGVNGLVELGMTQADAQNLYNVYYNLSALAGMFYGYPYPSGAPALPFNFYNEIVQLTGGQ